MAERLDVERLLGSIRVAYPPTPSIAPAVIARLETERARRARPLVPGFALWSRRRILVAVAIAVLALLGLAAAVRLSIGAVEIRVQPTGSPTGSPPPAEGPGALGEPVSISQAQAAVRFAVALPSGPAPDESYVFRTLFHRNGVLLAWRASDRYPAVSGTPWGLALMELTGDEEVVLKSVQSFEDVHAAVVDGRRAYWIPSPHTLEIQTAGGSKSYRVEGNVLVWQVGNVTYRLETSLGFDAALAIAGSIG